MDWNAIVICSIWRKYLGSLANTLVCSNKNFLPVEAQWIGIPLSFVVFGGIVERSPHMNARVHEL